MSQMIRFMGEIADSVKINLGERGKCWIYCDILGRGLEFWKEF